MRLGCTFKIIEIYETCNENTLAVMKRPLGKVNV